MRDRETITRASYLRPSWGPLAFVWVAAPLLGCSRPPTTDPSSTPESEVTSGEKTRTPAPPAQASEQPGPLGQRQTAETKSEPERGIVAAGPTDAPTAPRPDGAAAICVRREPHLPIDAAKMLGLRPMPPGAFVFRIDDRPPISVQADTGVVVPNIDFSESHQVVLLYHGSPIASANLRFAPERRCLGLSNYVNRGSGISLYSLDDERCGCAMPHQGSE